MSVDVSNRQTVNCLPGVSHLTFGSQGEYLHRGFIFSGRIYWPVLRVLIKPANKLQVTDWQS